MQFQKASAASFFARARDQNPPLFDRLIRKIRVSEPSACWPHMTASTTSSMRYGTIKQGGKSYRAHRLMYSLCFPGDLAGLEILHTCDNPPCVNPAHLRKGTHADNMLDRQLKGRGGNLRGMNNGRASLTDEQVREIQASSETAAALGRRFGVSKVTAAGIKRGAKWSHIK